MNNLYEKLCNLNKNEINVYLFSKHDRNKHDFEVFSTKIKENVCETFLNLIKNQIFKYINNDDYDKKDYCPVTKFDDYIVESIDINELSLFHQFQEEIENSHVLFKEDDLKKNHNLWLLVVVFELENNKLYSFQKIKSKKLLNKETKAFCINGGSLYDIEESVLTINENFDCIYEDNASDMLIFNKHYFELIFGFEDKFKEEIKSMLQSYEFDENIGSLLNISEFFNKIEKNTKHLKKTYKVLKDDNFNLLTDKNLSKVEKVCNIKFEKENGLLKLNHENIKKILYFLNGDYLESILSDEAYLTSNKMAPK